MPDDTKPVEQKADQNDLSAVLAGLKAIDGKMDSLATRVDSIEERVKARNDADFPPEEEAAADGPPPEVMDKIEGEGDADLPGEDAPPIMDAGEGDDLTELPMEDADAELEGDPEPLAADDGRRDGVRRDTARRDAVRRDAARKDAARRDAARKDAARKDAARKDKDARGDSSVTLSRKDYDALMKRFETVEKSIPKQLDDAEYDKFASAQARADSVYSAFGKSAPRPLQGESLLAYRRRLLTELKEHSPDWKASDLRVVAVDDATMNIAENQIYAAAAAAVRNPASVPIGTLREIKTKNDAGHTMTSFVGSPSAWMNRFAPTGRAITQINQNKGGNNP